MLCVGLASPRRKLNFPDFIKMIMESVETMGIVKRQETVEITETTETVETVLMVKCYFAR